MVDGVEDLATLPPTLPTLEPLAPVLSPLTTRPLVKRYLSHQLPGTGSPDSLLMKGVSKPLTKKRNHVVLTGVVAIADIDTVRTRGTITTLKRVVMERNHGTSSPRLVRKIAARVNLAVLISLSRTRQNPARQLVTEDPSPLEESPSRTWHPLSSLRSQSQVFCLPPLLVLFPAFATVSAVPTHFLTAWVSSSALLVPCCHPRSR